MNRNLNEKWFAWFCIATTVVVFLIAMAVKKLELAKASDIFSGVSTTITVDLLFWWVFSTWMWKLKIFAGWLVEIPDLNGTWKGELRSTWKNPKTGKRIKPIRTTLTVRQTLNRISCVMRTDEMTSRSFSEGFKVDGGGQICQLTYLYSSEPIMTVQHRSPNHLGAVRLDFGQNPKKLRGMYWTQRDTKGDVELDFHSNELIEQVDKVFQ
jgi:hypothetical protein